MINSATQESLLIGLEGFFFLLMYRIGMNDLHFQFNLTPRPLSDCIHFLIKQLNPVGEGAKVDKSIIHELRG